MRQPNLPKAYTSRKSGLLNSFPQVLKTKIASIGVAGLVMFLVVTAAASSAAAASVEATGRPTITSLAVEEVGASHVKINGGLVANGSETHWKIEYAENKAGPWTLATSGTSEPITEGTFFNQAAVAPKVHHLTPNTFYFARLVAENASGESVETVPFKTTALSPPEVSGLKAIEIPNRAIWEIGPYSANFEAEVETNGSETEYLFEYSTSPLGAWTLLPTASGSVAASEDFKDIDAHLSGLSPATEYRVRVVAINNEGRVESEKTFSTEPDHPQPSTSGVAHVTASSAELKGTVNPDDSETRWTYESASSRSGPWTPIPGAGGLILQAESTGYMGLETNAEVTGLAASTVVYYRIVAENEHGQEVSEISSFETAGPPAATTFVTHATQAGAVSVLGAIAPHGFETHYHFEYVSEEHFAVEGFENPSKTPESSAGGGDQEESLGIFKQLVVSQALPGVVPGATYHYRITATNGASGGATVYGEGKTLLVPSPPAPAPSSCPNEALRTGPSASLPDCRAYEQVTPIAKSAYNLFAHAGTVDHLTAADNGERVALQTIAQLGPNPGSESAPAGHGAYVTYVLVRSASGWTLTSVYPVGADHTGYNAEIFSPDLTKVGLQSSEFTTFYEHTGGLGMLIGPPGGPYASVVNVPVDDGFVKAAEAPGIEFDGSDASFKHIILSSIDHALAPAAAASIEHAPDLYEYSGDQLDLVNVTTAGSLINSCGAVLGDGSNPEGDFANNAVSSDGSKIFFTSPAPQHPDATGSSCEEPPQLYMRRSNTTTEISAPQGIVDPAGPQAIIYRGASGDGSKVFFTTRGELTKDDAGIHDEELYEYDTETGKLTRISHGDTGTAEGDVDSTVAGHPIVISEDGSTVYFRATGKLTSEAPSLANGSEDLYSYDTDNGETTFIAAMQPSSAQQSTNETTPNGKFLLFEGGSVQGVDSPGGDQLYRYDSPGRSITCVSCGEMTDGEVMMPQQLGTDVATLDRVPLLKAISDDGSYVFFATTAALSPKDVNNAEDVYEWHEGTITLLSGGRNPHGSEFLGEAADGRDVFFSSEEQLAPSDIDDQGDAYDARIDGGFAPPPPAIAPCEGDACATPFTAPSDPTPSSGTFHGAGDVLEEGLAKTKTRKKKKAKAKTRAKRKVRARIRSKHGTPIKRAAGHRHGGVK